MLYPDTWRKQASTPRRLLLAAATLLWLLSGLPGIAPASPPPVTPGPDGEPRLVLDRVEVAGNSRTPAERVIRALGLAAGDTVDQATLFGAVDALRHSGLFAAVEPLPRRGTAPGHVVLALQVRERGPRWRFGTGHTELDGWYLIPVELDLDNVLGRTERTRLGLRIGYRHAGVTASYREGGRGSRRSWWGVDLGAVTTDRIYFLDGVEVAHRVDRGWAGLAAGRRLGGGWSLRAGLRRESADAAPDARVYVTDEARGVHADDPVPRDRLPAAIAAVTGRRQRTAFSLELRLDTRDAIRCADTPAGGAWGRVRTGLTAQDGGPSFGTGELDLRLYRRAGPGVLAWRGRVAVAGRAAPFYDRLYLGGLYTLRGVPSQSLSRPGGDTWLAHASLEYRAPLVGDPSRPRLAGLLFADAGRSGDLDGAPTHDVRAAVGWGLRYRLGRWATAGIDVGLPLGPRPVPDAFRVHAALEWGF